MNTKIMIATHKPYRMPIDKELYMPVFVGSALHESVPEGYQSDAQGENISVKNPHYNELTAIYWAWHNLSADVIGLVHYRRYFVGHKLFGDKFARVLTRQEVEFLTQDVDVVVPKRRRYYVETIESHYRHSHDSRGLDMLRLVIEKSYPQYFDAFNHVLSSRSAHMFNMFIMKKQRLDEYASWLFDVLGEVEQNLDIATFEGNESRVLGFLSELLLDTWIETNRLSYKEVKVQFMENEHWVKKITVFILNKLSGDKAIVNTHVKG
ncbi:DUF4422 domain-containing protein [Lactiplantibacillus plantarum]|uniref:DUF4422 domain-containing protein n=1 Tax=Lactiplantibacillus plantarum TaxID=1590 RepID=UPI0025B4B25A|nr:DUF4422 domain-containing protein [Lactiplantibacillus plantarum]MDN3985556.1 DUF4422 domain-containing protein [Lactiplantibacillus plantarum]